MVIDRIEGDLAVLEVAGHTVDWPVSALPDDAAEGQVYDLLLSPVAPTDAAQARLQRLRARDPSPDSDDIDL